MKKTKRLLTWILASAMLLSTALPVFADESEGAPASQGASSAAADFLDTINNISYGEYLLSHEDIPAGKGEIVIDGKDFDPEATDEGIAQVVNGVCGYDGEVLLTSVDGKVTWTFDVPKAGMYNIKIDYCGVLDRDNIDLSEEQREKAEDGETTSSNIERVLYVNGKVPFAETRLISMKKTWTNSYTDGYVNGGDNEVRPFESDGNGNELRPKIKFKYQWESIALTDASTYYSDPFEYYFREGENTISLEGIREAVYIKSITLYTIDEYPSYADVLESYKDKGYTEADGVIRIDAEAPSAVSSSTIAPGYDRSSAISDPQDPTKIMRNIIGGTSWSTTSDWVKYEFTVEKTGLYNIVTRFKQDAVPGAFVSRALKINGEYPFDEARYCTFDYAQDWQVAPLQSGGTEFLFYFEEGETYEIELMATVGLYGELLTMVEDIADELNDYYLEIVKLTGAYPDTNRDYGFGRVMPHVVKGLSKCADRIDDILKQIDYMAGGVGSNTAHLESAMKTLRAMVKSDRSMASNITLLKSHISNLSSWCVDLESQPLQLDFLQIQGESKALPAAAAGFIDSMKYEFGQFIGSFYTDYNSFADDGEESENDAGSIEIWMSSGRDRATIIRDLVNSGFCKDTGINVSLKLVDASALLPSILAGIGPDLSLDGVATIDYAIRGAVIPLNDMTHEETVDANGNTVPAVLTNPDTPDFEDIVGTPEDWENGKAGRFYASSIEGSKLFGKLYALPTGVDFPMMFLRNDILASLGLEVPKTWDDFLSLIPVLQYNNMTVIFPSDYKLFLYQMGGDVWDQTSDNIMEWGWRTTYDDHGTLEAFSKMCNMFTQYSLLASADFQTRFKTGVAPVAITSYTSYTALTVFAPEIAGLWSMAPVPGTLKADGTIDNTAVASAGGLAMLKGVSDKEATWRFLCWYTDVDFQVDFCNELITLLGPAAKTTTANIEAMKEMPWTAAEEEALMSQYENTVGIPQYPGFYVIDRYTGMAFQNAYNYGENPAEALLSYVNAANKEISRKRLEFDYPIYEDSKKSDNAES